MQQGPQAAAQATGWVSPLDAMNYYEQSSTNNEDVEDDPRQSISDHLDSDPEYGLPYSDSEVEGEQPDGKLPSTRLATVSSMLLQHNEDTLRRILKLPRQRLKSSSSASKRWRKIRRFLEAKIAKLQAQVPEATHSVSSLQIRLQDEVNERSRERLVLV